MTSVGHVYQPPTPKTKFTNITTLSYSNADTGTLLPVPFTVTNGVLDIALTNSYVTAFVNNGDESNAVNIDVAAMGGRTKVNAIGSNLRTWVENFTGTSGPYPIVIAPTMTKIQPRGFNDDSSGDDSDNATIFHITAPTSDEYVNRGGPNDNYLTTWIFETPMTLQTPPWNGFSNSNTTLTLNSLFNYYY
jgi:hypothetical protein